MYKKLLLKLNKKGFTLIELLAVIVIISVIGTVIILSINSIIKSSKDKAYVTTTNNIKKSAAIYSKELGSDYWDIDKDTNNYVLCVSVRDLKNAGYFKENEFKETNDITDNTYVIVTKDKDNLTIISEEIDTTGYCDTTFNNAKLSVTGYTDSSITIEAGCGTLSPDKKNTFTGGILSSGIEISGNKYTYGNLNDNTNYNLSVECANGKKGNTSITTGNKNKIEELNQCTNKSKPISIKFSKTGTNYFFKIDSTGSTSNIVYECLNTKKETCSSVEQTNLKANTWYLSKNNEITINKNNNGVVYTYTSNSGNPSFSTYLTHTVTSIDYNEVNKPVITASDNIASVNWHSKNYTLNISGSINNNDKISFGTSNCNKVTYYYSTDGKNYTKLSTSEDSASINISTDSITTYYIKAINEAGTESNISTYVSKLDTTPPTIETSNITYGENAKITFKDKLSGLSAYCIVTNSQTIDNCDWKNITTPNEYSIDYTNNAGTYKIYAKDILENKTSAKELVISKANASNPSISGYSGTYDENSHTITVSGGSGGTIQYSTNNSSWSTTNPTRTNVGTTTVYVRVSGDSNHNTTSSISASITISKANASNPSISGYSGTYDKNSHTITVSGGSGGTIQYSTNNSSWSTSKPTRTDSGTTTVYVRVSGDSNHNTTTSISASIIINKANSANPSISDYSGTYDGNSHTITISGGSGGTIQYSTNNSSWSTSKPTRTDSGTTTVYVRVSGDSNHNTTTSISASIIINKANSANPSISGYSGTYDGKSHTITISGGSGGTIQYSTNNSSWSTSKPTRTDSGTTTVYVRVSGDSNHNTTTSISASIIINNQYQTINAYRCNNGNKYYITNCELYNDSVNNDMYCNYSSLNGVSQSGTIQRSKLSDECEKYVQKDLNGTWYAWIKAGLVFSSDFQSIYYYSSNGTSGVITNSTSVANQIVNFSVGTVRGIAYVKVDSNGNLSEYVTQGSATSKKSFIKLYTTSANINSGAVYQSCGWPCQNQASQVINGTTYYAVWVSATCKQDGVTCPPDGLSIKGF